MKEAWKGDNKPYRAVRLAIESAAAKNKLVAALPAYKKRALNNPFNPLDQYRYVLAAFTLAMKEWPIDPNVAAEWQIDLGGVKSPQTVDFSRLQFLVESVSQERPQVINLGTRLEKVYPNDKWIDYFLTKYRRRTNNVQEIRLIVASDRAKTKRDPSSVRAQTNLMESSFRLWLKTKKRSDSVAAVSAYKRYLVLVPNAPNKERINSFIRDIPQSQAALEAKGKGSRN